MNQKLSPHFSLSEFIKPGVKVTHVEMLNLTRLALALEKVRTILGNRPMTITSGYRTVKHNQAIGGAKNSWHLKGLAADFIVEGMTPQEVQKKLDPIWDGGLEYAPTWTHLDLGPKRRFHP